MTAYRFHGVNSDADTCSACGRTGLKRVVWLSPLDADGNVAGDPGAYGCDCAGQLLAGRKTTSNTRRVQEHGRRLDNVRSQLAAATDQLSKLCDLTAAELAGARILRVSSIRRAEGATALQIGLELHERAGRRVLELTAALADLETVEVADPDAAA